MEDDKLKEKVLKILRDNSNTLAVEAHGQKSRLTFVGSVNYEGIAEKIVESLKEKSSP